MRLANQRDQQIIAGAMTNGAQSSVNFLSSVANRECIAFGEGLKTPMRMTFETITHDLLPGRHVRQELLRELRQERAREDVIYVARPAIDLRAATCNLLDQLLGIAELRAVVVADPAFDTPELQLDDAGPRRTDCRKFPC